MDHAINAVTQPRSAITYMLCFCRIPPQYIVQISVNLTDEGGLLPCIHPHLCTRGAHQRFLSDASLLRISEEAVSLPVGQIRGNSALPHG